MPKEEIAPGSRVLLGMTGGLASTVAAFLLKSQGLEVLGVAMQFFPPDKKDKKGKEDKKGKKGEEGERRCQVDDLALVKGICRDLDMPFYAVNGEAEFQLSVWERVVAARLSGQFFSTCVECQLVKFNLLQAKAKKLNCQYIATGHLAKIHREEKGDEATLYAFSGGQDDESHLLSKVSQDDLQNVIFPLANLSKKAIWEIAEKNQLKYDERPEREESCFFDGERTRHYLKTTVHKSLRGPVILFDGDKNAIQGYSEDALDTFTTGQKGIQSSDKVCHINPQLAVTDISFRERKVTLGREENLQTKKIKLAKLRLPDGFDRSRPRALQVRFEDGKVHEGVLFFKNNDIALLELNESVYNKSKGHAVALYQNLVKNSKLLGYGVVV